MWYSYIQMLHKNSFCDKYFIHLIIGTLFFYSLRQAMCSHNNNTNTSLKAFKVKAYIDVVIGKETRRKRYIVQSKWKREHREERNH